MGGLTAPERKLTCGSSSVSLSWVLAGKSAKPGALASLLAAGVAPRMELVFQLWGEHSPAGQFGHSWFM